MVLTSKHPMNILGGTPDRHFEITIEVGISFFNHLFV